jgi:hypothetical protein
LLGLAALSSKVPHLSTVVAGKLTGGKLLWWPDGSQVQRWARSAVTGGKLLWWPDGSQVQQWARSAVELLLLCLLELPRLELWTIAPVLLWLQLAQLTPMWGIHHAVFGRSTGRTTTTSGSRHHLHSLFLIGLNNGLH